MVLLVLCEGEPRTADLRDAVIVALLMLAKETVGATAAVDQVALMDIK